MQSSRNADSPQEHPPLKISLAADRLGWRKHRPLLLKIRAIVLMIVFFVVCIPFLPLIALVGLIIGSMHLFELYKKYKHKVAMRNGILPSELSASQKTTVYLSGSDVSGYFGRTDIEYSQSAQKVSFNYRGGNGRYHVYGTRAAGLYMLVPLHRKITPEKVKNGPYFQCDIVRVNGGNNHGDFSGKSPMGSDDCVVLICKRVSMFPPSRDLVVFIGDDTTGSQRIDVGHHRPASGGLTLR